ncbi:sigma-54-dependent Fis family transcriptional regulator [Pseudoalteromonas rubra]|uniref:Sigma-54-dependent Fis family transcriptional regulator n=1 Tax=Pseudoalteromonas rubra TaxID=43658 RepID=A0A5S3WHP7_9GAMM|nr:sigma-54 dependent transcriptional regulator [Pseudoalteromonas rubra]TMP26721.1 sigma-54-dependent Fis family transcriptional regulator [Pseudoalteromonas rubra]TMP30694.1 sigma-54-dependent Fis family transcriptional regulator [Pseudoalteromonas rubra]
MAVLVVDDNPEVRLSAAFLLEDHGFEVYEAEHPEVAKQFLSCKSIDQILLDMNFTRDTTSGNEGLTFLRWLQSQSSAPAVICLTGWGSVPLAVEAMRLGAADFIEKPWQNAQLLDAIRKQSKLNLLQVKQGIVQSTETDIPCYTWRSTAMKTLLNKLSRIASTDASVLLCGESGCGKSHLVEALHRQSPRRTGPLVSVNMGAIPDSLFESEMFGHTKGAFTDAKSQRSGRFELAGGGTLFLDEVATIPLAQQAKLLRVLESGEYERVGSSRTEHADIRLICATNSDLEQDVTAGRFRSDLFYRINTFTFELPPLRARLDDIVPLANHLLARHAARYQLAAKSLDSEAQAALLAYRWPGNIRELSHVMERALLLSEGAQITASDCQLRLAAPAPEQQPGTQPQPAGTTLAEVEKNLIEQTLALHQGQVSEAAKALGLTKSSLYRRLDKYGLRSED